MSSNNFYTNSSITLMYSLPYIYKHSKESHFPLVKRAFPNVIIKCNLSTASRREQRGGGGGGGAFDRFEAKIRSWHENLDPTLRKTLLSSRFRPRWNFSSKHLRILEERIVLLERSIYNAQSSRDYERGERAKDISGDR